MNTRFRSVLVMIAAAAIAAPVALAQSIGGGVGPADNGEGAVEEPQRDYTLRLGELSFDPVQGLPRLIDIDWATTGNPGPDVRLVQFDGPTQQAWLDGLEAAGLEVVQYVYPHAYIVWGDEATANAARDLPGVRWSGEFMPVFRALPKARHLDNAVADLKVMLYRGADVNAAMNQLADLGAEITMHRPIDEKFDLLGVNLAGNRVQEAAKIAGVYTIQITPTDGGHRSETSNQICAGNYDSETKLAFPGYASWLSGIGVDGTGVVMANVDGGVDQTHVDLAGRMLGCTGTTCGGAAMDSHGTHTAGIMAADGSSGTLDAYGFIRGQGVAPGANLIEQKYAPHSSFVGGMLLLMKESSLNNAVLSSNSWGPSGSPQGYDNDTYQVDVGVRDAVNDVAGNQPLTYVLAIMNGYGGTSTQGSPDEAKNLIAVGATNLAWGSGQQRADIANLGAVSAHGPALDGRKLPHLVAPGYSVDSTGLSDTYNVQGGTSMACPHVAGAAALFIEQYRALGVGDPSPALIKAAMLPVCHDLNGAKDADGGTMGHPFDNKQGWGRLNLSAMLTAPSDSVQYYDDPQLFDNTGEEWSIELEPVDAGQPVRMMLVWTDAPGHGLGGSTPAWNNNLDLVVEAGADEYLGNSFGVDGFSAPNEESTPDIKNNTEGVFLGPTPPTSFTVQVVATDINSDGVPSVGDVTDQDFALVVYNAREPVACPADVSGDGQVDIQDVFVVLGLWGEVGGPGDVNNNNIVDIDDIFAVLGQWGDCP